MAEDVELRKKIRSTRVYKAAVSMHEQYRADQENLERFSRSWEEELFRLIRAESINSAPHDYSAVFESKESWAPFEATDDAQSAASNYVAELNQSQDKETK